MLCKLCVIETLVRRYEPERRKCEKKKFTKREAQKALNEVKRWNKPYKREQRIYRCPYPECGSMYHLTSKPEDSAFAPAEIKFASKWKSLINY